MKKNNYELVTLGKGEVNVYDFDGVKLHAYKTNDFLSDEVFILEKAGKAVVIESPAFFDNCTELAQYIGGLGIQVEGKLIAYHMAGGTFLPEVPVYATKNADEYGHTGGGKALVDNFTGTFGESFDNSLHTVTNVIAEGPVAIAGITMNIIGTHEAFDIEIPEIKTVYTHMLGHDCHSIVAGAGHADAIIGQLKGYLEEGCDLVLTSHYTPEDLKDVEIKIAYLENLKLIAAKCASIDEFKIAVQKDYGSYDGGNYLDMRSCKIHCVNSR